MTSSAAACHGLSHLIQIKARPRRCAPQWAHCSTPCAGLQGKDAHGQKQHLISEVQRRALTHHAWLLFCGVATGFVIILKALHLQH